MDPSTPIRALAEDRNGNIWIGTWFDGIYRYDGRAYHHYLLGIESPGNAVSSILFDSEGGLWVGTYTGVFYFPTGEIDPELRSHLLESKLTTCILEDRDGSVLVGTSTGLFRIRNDDAVAVSGMSHPYVLSLIAIAWATHGWGQKRADLIQCKASERCEFRLQAGCHRRSSTLPSKMKMAIFGWARRAES